MTATYNPAEIERLVREAVRRACLAVERTAATAVRIEQLDAIVDRAVQESLAAMADQLEAARVEILNLGSQLAHERGRVEGAAIGAEYLKRELEAARERIVELETALAQVRQ